MNETPTSSKNHGQPHETMMEALETNHRIIRALSRDCCCAYHIDLGTGRFRQIGMHACNDDTEGVDKENFDASFGAYIEKAVIGEDMPRIRQALTVGSMRAVLRGDPEMADTFRAQEGYRVHTCQYRAIKISDREGEPQEAVLMLRIVDDMVEREYQNHIALQKAKEELARRYSMIVALSQEYHSLWLSSKDGRNIRLIRSTGTKTIQSAIRLGFEYAHVDQALDVYIQDYVDAADQQRVREETRFDTVLEMTPEKGLYTVNYLRHTDAGKTGYHQIAFARASREDGDYDIIIAFRDVDAIVREEQEKRRILRDALASAERANRAKTTFLSNMSHDIRTPMNAIIGFTTLALTHIDNRELMRDYLGKIATSSNHLLSLINDVLDMSRIESGKMHLEQAECSLSDILRDLRSILSADLRAKNLSFSFETIDVFDERVICDRLRLNQILLNIVGNAIKFTNPGGRISVRLTQRPGASRKSGSYEFRIEDNGIGMSREFIAHVFEPFERERTSTVSGIQGAGLGLAITKNIVDMMNGTIEVKSTKDVGTEFVVTLPLEKAEAEPKNDKMEEQACCAEKLMGKRLLLVEDNDLNREIAAELLGDCGLLIEEAADGTIALERMLERGAGYYDAVLMDIQMPVMDGYAAARAIRAFDDPGLAAVPIVAMTANAFDEDKKRAMEAGMNGHVSKPIRLDKLLKELESLL